MKCLNYILAIAAVFRLKLTTGCFPANARPVAHRPIILGEPYNEQEIRRIHVDPPTGNADRDPMDLKWHMPKRFPARTRNGRLRRFVFEYDEPKILRDFYTDVFGWDIINTETSNPERPLMYCATGPGNANWEPRVVSFCYGFLKARDSEDTGLHPMYVIEVDSIDKTVELVEQYGGNCGSRLIRWTDNYMR